jgi:hypothetical protein
MAAASLVPIPGWLTLRAIRFSCNRVTATKHPIGQTPEPRPLPKARHLLCPGMSVMMKKADVDLCEERRRFFRVEYR